MQWFCNYSVAWNSLVCFETNNSESVKINLISIRLDKLDNYIIIIIYINIFKIFIFNVAECIENQLFILKYILLKYKKKFIIYYNIYFET